MQTQPALTQEFLIRETPWIYKGLGLRDFEGKGTDIWDSHEGHLEKLALGNKVLDKDLWGLWVMS